MIDYNQVTVRQGVGSDGRVQTLSGSITLEEATSRLVVRDGAGQERTIVDILGLTTIRANGEYSNRVGQARDDNRDGVWVAKVGEDLRDEGIG